MDNLFQGGGGGGGGGGNLFQGCEVVDHPVHVKTVLAKKVVF